MGQLAAKLLAYEVAASFNSGGLRVVLGVDSHAAFEAGDEGILFAGGTLDRVGVCAIRVGRVGVGFGIFGIYAETAFLIDIAVAYGDDNGVDGDVHHYHIKDQEANAEFADRNNVEAARADGESLEETIKGAGGRREVRVDGCIANLCLK